MKDYLIGLGFNLHKSTAAVDRFHKRVGDHAVHVMHFKNSPEEIHVSKFEFNEEAMDWCVVKEVTFTGSQHMDAKLFVQTLGI